MAFPDRQWARGWRKFVQDRFWLDSLQMGQLLLLTIALLTLLFLLMFVFCCSFPCNKKRRRHKKRAREAAAAINRTPSTAFSATNEERRRLLQPLAQNCPQFAIQIEDEREADGTAGEDRQNTKDGLDEKDALVPPGNHPHFVKHQVQPPSLTSPYVGGYGRRQFMVEQSPPPPRRLAPAGGKTQVLPLTGSNKRRVPALILLMADQQGRQSAPNSGGARSVGTPESRTTTGGAKSCETIPEDPEVDASISERDELMSIDRTLLSYSTTPATGQAGPTVSVPSQFPAQRTSFRLASPFPQPPPKFEIMAPTYSPPEPPSAAESTCRIGEPAANGGSTTTRSNLSSPDQSSYGGQTPLNTTTGSSESAAGDGHQGNGGKIRISELECSEIGRSEAEMEELEGCWLAATQQSHQCPPPLPPGLASLPPGRVPRSISQQLELMEEMAAAAAAEKR